VASNFYLVYFSLYSSLYEPKLFLDLSDMKTVFRQKTRQQYESENASHAFCRYSVRAAKSIAVLAPKIWRHFFQVKKCHNSRLDDPILINFTSKVLEFDLEYLVKFSLTSDILVRSWFFTHIDFLTKQNYRELRIQTSHQNIRSKWKFQQIF
jgi:hypothetical protein